MGSFLAAGLLVVNQHGREIFLPPSIIEDLRPHVSLYESMKKVFSPTVTYSLLLLFPVVWIVICYLPNFYEGFFNLDDESLILIPQLRAPFNLQMLKTIFSVGNHVDFYPLRDLSYWLDIKLSAGGATVALTIKYMNLVYFYFTGVFIFLTIKQLKVPAKAALFFVMLWMLHPFHNEMLFWASARKDLLSLMFFAISSYLLLLDLNRGSDSKTQSFFWWGLAFATAAALAKSGAILTALAWIPIAYSQKKDRLIRIKSSALIALVVGIVFLNSYVYQNVNNMRFIYPFTYQLEGTLLAFGRSFAGLFWPDVNAIDPENWGQWAELNRIYLLPATLGALGTIAFFYMAIREHRHFGFALLGVGLSLAATPGWNPLHRNFYSTRYYELPFLILLGAFFIFLVRKHYFSQKLRSITLILFIGILSASARERNHWETNLNLVRKSINLTPQNPALLRMNLLEYSYVSKWGRQSADDTALATQQILDIETLCKIPANKTDTADLCLNLWLSLPEYRTEFSLKNLTQEDLAFDVGIKQLSEMTGFPVEYLRKALLKRLDSIESVEALQDYHSWLLKRPLSTENVRILKIMVECLLDPQLGRRSFMYFNRSYLVSASAWAENLSVVRDSARKEEIKNCVGNAVFLVR